MNKPSIYEMFELDDQAIKTYSTFPRFTIKEAAAVMLNLNPYYCGHYDVETDRNFSALVSAIDTAAIHDAFTTAEFEYGINGDKWAISISNDELREWAIFYGYEWKLKKFTPFKSKTAINEPKESENLSKTNIEKDEIIESQRAENETLRARIDELENQLKEQSAVDSEQVLELPKATRTSQAQRDIFSLLVVQNYPNCVTRNSLLESINADLRRIGINTKGISYPTLNNLIDEDLRIKATTQDGKTIEKSPFPDKAKK